MQRFRDLVFQRHNWLVVSHASAGDVRVGVPRPYRSRFLTLRDAVHASRYGL